MAVKKPTFNPEVKKPGEEEESGEDTPLKKKESETEETEETKEGEEEGEEGEEGEETEEGKEEEDKDIESKDIPVRKSVQQHIIARKNKVIKKLRSKVEGEETEETEETQPPEDEELTTEAKTAVKREVRRAVDPLMDQLVRKTDEDELQELYGNEPEAKKYDKRIRSYMKSDEWKGVPPSAIFHHLAFDNAIEGRIKRRKAADTEATLNKGGGRHLRPKAGETGNVPSKEEMEEMSDEELEGLQHKVRTGQLK